MKLDWPEALICPECGPGQDHPQPFQDAAGRWLCGKCWFINQIATVMEIKIIRPKSDEKHH